MNVPAACVECMILTLSQSGDILKGILTSRIFEELVVSVVTGDFNCCPLSECFKT